MNLSLKASALLAVAVLGAGLLAGGLFSAVPREPGMVMVVNRFTGTAKVCGASECRPLADVGVRATESPTIGPSSSTWGENDLLVEDAPPTSAEGRAGAR